MKTSPENKNRQAQLLNRTSLAQAVADNLRCQSKADVFCALSLCTMLSMASSLQAAQFEVTNTTDADPGSLRVAIQSANTAPGPDEIIFNASVTGVITLTSGALEVTDTLNITGPGASELEVNGNNSSSVFFNQSTFTISGLTVSNGSRNSGGGIFNSGNLTVSNSTITGNNASGAGGGIYNDPGNATTTVEINNSTISDNEAMNGGGIYNNNTGSGTAYVNINNSTISGNIALSQGGGIRNSAKDNNDAQAIVTINNSTINGNTSNNASLRDGGGIYNYASNGGTANVIANNSTVSGNMANSAGGIGSYAFMYGATNITINNSTITGNNTSDTGANHGAVYVGQYYRDSVANVTISNSIIAAQLNGDDCWGFFVSNGFNLGSDGTCYFNQTTDFPNTNMPFLGPLMDNGGSTFTHALMAGSPAIDAIPSGMNDCGSDLVIDQRGVLRPQDGNNDSTAACDIGAFEVARTNNNKIGDYVWEDTDGDGRQDNDEIGLDYVTVNLHTNCQYPANGVNTNHLPQWFASTMTAGDGSFEFDNLPEGFYQLEFVKPDGHTYSPYKAAGDFTKDSNANPANDGFDACVQMAGNGMRLSRDAGFVPQAAADTLTIERAIYYADTNKMWIRADSDALPPGSSNITAIVSANGDQTVLGDLGWKPDKSKYQQIFHNVTTVPDTVFLMSDTGGMVTGSVEIRGNPGNVDAVSILRTFYYPAQNRVWVKADSDASPDGSAMLTASIMVNGNEMVLGPIPWRQDKHTYQTNFYNVTVEPDSLKIISNLGSIATTGSFTVK